MSPKAGTRVDVIAANDVAVLWLQQPPRGVRSLDELQRVAAARCAHLHGGQPQDWWVAGAWDADQPFVCSALPQHVVTNLRTALGPAAQGTRWHTAWGLVAQRAAASFPSEGWGALHSPRRVVFWHCRRGRVASLSSMACDPAWTAGQAAARMTESARLEALREELPLPDRIAWASLVADTEGMVGAVHGVRISGVRPVARDAGEAQAALSLLPLVGDHP